MSGLIVEALLYVLLLFTPMAFGGVETWALGVFQILTALMLAAWALGEGNPFRRRETEPSAPDSTRRPLRVLWACIGLFVLLVLVQLLPMPPGLIRTLSPATWSLYAETLPGYAQGEGFATSDLPDWLLADQREGMPESAAEQAGQGAPGLPLDQAPDAMETGAWRTLSVDPYLTRERLTMLLCLVAVFYVVTGYFQTRKRLERLLAVALGSVVVVSLFGIIQKLAWNGKLYWIREGNYGKVFGPFVNKNNYAALAVTVLPLAVCLAFRALHRHRRAQREAIPLLVLNSFAAVIITAGIFYSLSRGGMLAAAFSIAIVGVLLFYFGRHTTELAFLAAIFVVAGAVLVWVGSGEVVERMESITEGPKSPSMGMRFTAWESALGLIGDNWLVGTGLGSFRFAFMRYAPPGRSWWTTAHNEFIEVFTDTGLTGGLLALTGLVAFFMAVMKPGRFRGRTGRFAWAGLLAGILALLAHANVTSDLQLPANSLLLVVLGGALVCHVRLQGRSRSHHTSTPNPSISPLEAIPSTPRRRRRRRRP